MSPVTRSLLDLIGNTPMLDLPRIADGGGAQIWGKLEFLNPSGSVKDRIALAMIAAAERRGALEPGGTVVGPTSGNMGIGLAWVCALKGYRMIAVLPEAMSRERVQMLRALGAEVEIVPCQRPGPGQFTGEDIRATMARASELAAKIPGAFMPNQFENTDNPASHGRTTAREILDQAGEALEAFVAAVGTGGGRSPVWPRSCGKRHRMSGSSRSNRQSLRSCREVLPDTIASRGLGKASSPRSFATI